MKLNLSFAGCGFLGIYHVGVVSCFKQYTPFLIGKLLGASAGAISACTLLCECPLGQLTSDAVKIASTANKLSLGPFNPKFDVMQILQERLEQILPADAHVRCSGRLYVSCTRVGDGKNFIINQFASKNELIEALLCSSFIPVFSGLIPPTYRGVRYMDGCYSDNLPVLDGNTVTVSPFCGECDICPRDDSYNILQINLANTSIELSSQNFYRLMRVLFPPNPEILSKMCKQGFDDALHFLRRNDLISCSKCIAMMTAAARSKDGSSDDSAPKDDSSSHITIEESAEKTEVFLECSECVEKKRKALMDDLPEVVLQVLEEACASMNRGIVNWIFKHKPMWFLSVLTLPYVLPLDFAYVIFVKLLHLTPKIGLGLARLAGGIFTYIRNVFFGAVAKPRLFAAKFTCEVEVDANDGCTTTPNDPGRQMPVSMATRKKSVTDKTTPLLAMTGSVNIDFSLDIESSPEQLINATTLPPAVLELIARVPEDGHDTFDQVLYVTQLQEALQAWYYLTCFDQLQPTAEIVSSPQEDCHYTVVNEEEDGLTSQRIHDVVDMDAEITATDILSNSCKSSLGIGDDDGYLLDHVVIDSALRDGNRWQPAPCLIGE